MDLAWGAAVPEPLIELTTTVAEHSALGDLLFFATADLAAHRRQIARGILAAQAARHLLGGHQGGGVARHGRPHGLRVATPCGESAFEMIK